MSKAEGQSAMIDHRDPKPENTTITGEVTMANVKGYRATLNCEGNQAQVDFPPEREEDVTSALHEHRVVRLRVRGDGEVDLKTGKLKKLTAEDLEIVRPADPEAPSEALFERLAEHDPARLLALLDDELDPALLTFAADVAGRLLPSDDVVPVLLRLLGHPSPLVREGGVYGLASHITAGVDSALADLVHKDPSPGVRIAARDVLENKSGRRWGCRTTSQQPPCTQLAKRLSEAREALRIVCAEFGDNDWSDDLSLADVIEKHLARHLRDARRGRTNE